jgi:hypothetical protein
MIHKLKSLGHHTTEGFSRPNCDDFARDVEAIVMLLHKSAAARHALFR